MGAIIWLASYPKSGNTWVRAFLHNFMRDPKESYDINKLTDFTLGDSHAPWYFQIDPRPASEYTREEVRAMRPMVHRKMTEAFPDSVFVKTHNALVLDEGVPMVTLEVTAGAIYIVRNPLDVVISYAHHLGRPIDETIGILGDPAAATANGDKNVYEFPSSWSENVHSWTHAPNPGLHVLRYEDMLESPTKTFGGIAKFLGIDAARPRLEKAIKLSSFKVLKEQERRRGFIERSQFADQFFREGKTGQWRKVLTKEQVDRVVEDHHDQMKRFGYLP